MKQTMKLSLLVLLLPATAAQQIRQKRLNEKPPQRRENELPSNDGMNPRWFTEALRPNTNPSSQSNSTLQPPITLSPTTHTPTSHPTMSPTAKFNGIPSLPLTSRMGCPSSQRKLRFEINVDKWGAETTWEVRQLSNNHVVMSNSKTYAPYDEEVVEMCVDSGYPEMQYRLTIFDEVVSEGASNFNGECVLPNSIHGIS